MVPDGKCSKPPAQTPAPIEARPGATVPCNLDRGKCFPLVAGSSRARKLIVTISGHFGFLKCNHLIVTISGHFGFPDCNHFRTPLRPVTSRDAQHILALISAINYKGMSQERRSNVIPTET